MKFKLKGFRLLILLVFSSVALKAQQSKQWITYQPNKGPGNGKYIVFVSGDEEYRSEESLPLLAKILAKEDGFKTTVLFAINPKTAKVDPNYEQNIPGLEHLEQADLMVIFTRFRELPDSQMKYINEYIQAGKPVVGMRTATHAFRYQRNLNSPYAKYSFDSKVDGWFNGFGRRVFGETWISHHGVNHEEGTRGLINGALDLKNLAILRGVHDIFVQSGTYTSRQDLGGDAKILVWGQPTNGMTPESKINVDKSAMPVAWIRNYTSDEGNTGRAFATTMGTAVDLKNEGFRKLMVNACYWALGMESQITDQNDAKIIGEFEPTNFGDDKFKKDLEPSDFK